MGEEPRGCYPRQNQELAEDPRRAESRQEEHHQEESRPVAQYPKEELFLWEGDLPERREACLRAAPLLLQAAEEISEEAQQEARPAVPALEQVEVALVRVQVEEVQVEEVLVEEVLQEDSQAHIVPCLVELLPIHTLARTAPN